jgi:hypothetical protein
MQGKKNFHAELNKTRGHYVNKYGNDWDECVDYALTVHRATPNSITKFSPSFLPHGRDIRMPNTGDLSARMEAPREEPEKQDRVNSHINALAISLS